MLKGKTILSTILWLSLRIVNPERSLMVFSVVSRGAANCKKTHVKDSRKKIVIGLEYFSLFSIFEFISGQPNQDEGDDAES